MPYFNVIGYIDREKNKTPPLKMYAISDINQIEFDYIIIAINNAKTASSIKAELISRGVGEKKILWEKPLTAAEYFLV